MTIDLKLPLDGSLTSLLIYEGILYTLRRVFHSVTMPAHGFTISRSDLISMLREDLDERRLQSLNISIVGKNDRPSVRRLLNGLGVKSIRQKKEITKFGDILRLISRTRSLRIGDKIEIGIRISRNKLYIGYVVDEERNDKGITFQIFKTERYTGLTSTEHLYTAKQITAYMTPEVALFTLIGLYSSFVVTSDNTHYMLFFAPEEMSSMLSGDKDIETMFLLKNKCREILAEIVRKKYSEELVIVETLLNINIQNLLSKNNIKSVMLILLKLAREGQVYKIYQQVPLALYERSKPALLQVLTKILDPSGIVLSRLARVSSPEYSNLVSVVVGIYRYVVLGELLGLYSALRELHNAYVKVSKEENARNISTRYLHLLRQLSTLSAQM